MWKLSSVSTKSLNKIPFQVFLLELSWSSVTPAPTSSAVSMLSLRNGQERGAVYHTTPALVPTQPITGWLNLESYSPLWGFFICILWTQMISTILSNSNTLRFYYFYNCHLSLPISFENLGQGFPRWEGDYRFNQGRAGGSCGWDEATSYCFPLCGFPVSYQQD